MIPVRVISSLSKLIIIMGFQPVKMWQHSCNRLSPNVGFDVRVSRWKKGKNHPANEWSYKNWLSVFISLMYPGKCVVQGQASNLP